LAIARLINVSLDHGDGLGGGGGGG
jgi:hypothetical protein